MIGFQKNVFILSPSPPVILSPSLVTLSETKGLDLRLRINYAKDLVLSQTKD